MPCAKKPNAYGLARADQLYEKDPAGTRYYVWSAVNAAKDVAARVIGGGLKAAAVYLNGTVVKDLNKATLHVGANPLLARYDMFGRGHLIVELADAPKDWKQKLPLAMTWHNKPGILPFDVQPAVAKVVGWYRFTSPPGLRAMTVVVRGMPQAWVNGQEAKVEEVCRLEDGSSEFRIVAAELALKPATVALRIQQQRGCYGGAAIPEPITLDCGKGLMALGDWSKVGSLECYSGGAWYRKTVLLSSKQPNDKVTLDLGSVAATAEVRVNGQFAGIKARPLGQWTLNSSILARIGSKSWSTTRWPTIIRQFQRPFAAFQHPVC